MALELERMERLPLSITAVRVTKENFDEVLEWCGGTRGESVKNPAPYIMVPVVNPIKTRHSMAFVGDWVTLSDDRPDGWKVYMNLALLAAFKPEALEHHNVFDQ